MTKLSLILGLLILLSLSISGLTRTPQETIVGPSETVSPWRWDQIYVPEPEGIDI